MCHCINSYSELFTLLRNYLYLGLVITCQIKELDTVKAVDINEIYILFHVLLSGYRRGVLRKLITVNLRFI